MPLFGPGIGSDDGAGTDAVRTFACFELAMSIDLYLPERNSASLEHTRLLTSPEATSSSMC